MWTIDRGQLTNSAFGVYSQGDIKSIRMDINEIKSDCLNFKVRFINQFDVWEYSNSKK